MHAAAGIPGTCENCGTMLQGEFCHACGQGAHNPLHDVRHALEEVFESFWHLDGRAFRTLRDLLVPGRVACNYLAGQRVRYIPPLRLFLVLTVLTFFVGHFIVGRIEDAPGGGDPVVVHTGDGSESGSPFRNAATEAEVQAILDRQLADLTRAQTETRSVPFAGMALKEAEAELRRQADTRRATLRGRAPPGAPASVPVAPAPRARQPERVDDRSGAQVADQLVRMIDGVHLRDAKRPWDASTNPVDIPWLPGFGDHWFNHRLANAANNVDRMKKDGKSLFFELMLAAVPSALFVLVPVFALLLRVFYLLSGRGWLEHLVVALYSHAFLLLTLFATFVLVLLPLPAALTGWIIALGWVWAAIYLLLMQRRVYGQGWSVTVLKYFAIGFLYQFLLVGAMFYTVFTGLSSGA